MTTKEQPVLVLSGHWVAQLAKIPDKSVQCIITSPPYWGLREYLQRGTKEKKFELGLEATPALYIEKLVAGCKELWRVLRDDGTFWLNLGDKSYNYRPGPGADTRKRAWKNGERDMAKSPAARTSKLPGLKEKDILGLPWRVAFALQAAGWYLRQDIIWHKPNPLPESAKDRPARNHEYIFLLTKRPNYFYDWFATLEPSTGTAKPRGKVIPPPDDHPELTMEIAPSNEPEKLHKVAGQNPKAMAPEANGEIRHRSNENYAAAITNTTAMRNKRSVWTVHVHPFAESHYATFPPDLIRPCILAGTSAKGACGLCGAPWERLVTRGETDLEFQRQSGGDKLGRYKGQGRKDYKGAKAQNPSEVKKSILAGMTSRRTAGWKATCDCVYPETVPCVVLDPFGGSGTTGQVALEYGRHAILIELNPKSIDLIHKRTSVTSGLSLT